MKKNKSFTKVIRSQAMKKVVKILKLKGIDLSKMKALEIFAREGDWQTLSYADKVASLEAWEIDPSFKKGLKKNLRNAKIKITDSIKEISKKANFYKYDFIVVDNPQYCYGPKLEHCEHFSVIPKIAKLLNNKGVIIFNINKQPFGFDTLPLWQNRRSDFYGVKDTSKMSVNWLLDFYKKLFMKFGYKTKIRFNVPRKTKDSGNYLHYLVFFIEKND